MNSSAVVVPDPDGRGRGACVVGLGLVGEFGGIPFGIAGVGIETLIRSHLEKHSDYAERVGKFAAEAMVFSVTAIAARRLARRMKEYVPPQETLKTAVEIVGGPAGWLVGSLF